MTDLSLIPQNRIENLSAQLEATVNTSGNQTIAGEKTFTNVVYGYSFKAEGEGSFGQYSRGYIELSPSSSSNIGGYIDFHYNGDTSDNTSRIIEDASGTLNINGSKFSKTLPATVYVNPTENTISSKQIDTVGARNTKLQNYLQIADQGNLLPNFDVMTPVQTVEFDTSDSDWHTIFTRTNTETNAKDLTDILYFRLTVTGTDINHIIDYLVYFRGQLNYPIIISNNFPGTSDANYTGPRYMRAIFPKALNNGYDWSLEFLQNRNNNARHYKVEIYKTNSKITWTQGTTSIYNGTYHNAAQWGVETTSGYWVNWFNGTFNQSSWASNINGQLSKIINTNLPSGEALLANQFLYMNNNKFYPASNKTLAIEPGYGIQINITAYNANNDVGWDRVRQKCRITSLTNIPHATLARGNPCYFRCTTDANGNILSDNYIDTSMTAGYTWYYVGIAESSSIINIDTTQSFFITLDSNGKISRINGKGLSGGGSGGIADSITNQNSASGAVDPIYDWVGTLAEYNSQTVATSHPEWICFITDDNTNSAYQAYNKSETDALLATKADDNTVVKLTGNQTITGTKTFSGTTRIKGLYMTAENASTKEGGQIAFESGAQEANAGKTMYIDRYNGIFRFVGVNSGDTTRVPLQVDIQNNTVLGVTPAVADNSTKIATTAFVNNKFQVVSALPSSPTSGVFYFVKE